MPVKDVPRKLVWVRGQTLGFYTFASTGVTGVCQALVLAFLSRQDSAESSAQQWTEYLYRRAL